MDTHWWLSEGFGPRATGTPGYQAAADWAMKKFNEWGLKNVHIERFPFGQGWSIDRFSVHLLTPQPAPLVGSRAGTRRRPTARSLGRRAREGGERSRPRKIQRTTGRQDRDPAGGAAGAHARGSRRAEDERQRLGRGDEAAGAAACRRTGCAGVHRVP